MCNINPLCRKELTKQTQFPCFESPACRVDPWLVSGKLDFREAGGTILRTDESGPLCLKCADNIVFPEHLLSLWEFGIWMSVRGCLHDQPPIKTLGTEFLTSFPGWQQLGRSYHNSLPGWIKWILCYSTGRGPFKTYIQFSLDFIPWAFSLCSLYFVAFCCNTS